MRGALPLVVALLVGLLVVGAAAPVAANHQQTPADSEPDPTATPTSTPTETEAHTSTPTSTPTAVDDPTATEAAPEPEPTRNDRQEPPAAGGQQRTFEEPTEVVAEVDEDIRVLDYGLADDGATFWLELENRGDRSSKVTVTEAISGDQTGAGRFGIEQVRVESDEQVRVQVSINPDSDTKGVMITTSKSVSQGRGTYLQVDDSASLFDFGASWNTVRVAWLGGVIAVVSTVLGGAWWLVAARREDVEDADLDPDQTLWGSLR